MVLSDEDTGFKRGVHVHSVATGELLFDYDFVARSPDKRTSRAVPPGRPTTRSTCSYEAPGDVSELWRLDPATSSGSKVGSLTSVDFETYFEHR